MRPEIRSTPAVLRISFAPANLPRTGGETLETRKLGRSGIAVSVLALGCWPLGGGPGWGDQDERLSIATIHRALDKGINFFDTAESYADGRSEEILGKALADRRDRAIVGTKISPNHTEPSVLRAHCEASLRRLQSDYIDVYMVHWPIRTHAAADSFAVLNDLKAEGKVRTIGVSNFGVEQLTEALATGVQLEVNQLCYSLLSRAIEIGIVPFCQEHQVSVTAYMPLMQGLLTGKYRTVQDVPPFRTRTRHFSGDRPGARHREAGAEEETFAAIDAIRDIAGELGQPMANVALAWTMAKLGVASVLAGARTPEQVARNVPAASLSLAPDVVARLDRATDALKRKLGPNADYWQDAENARMR
jgi:myo-inositol catabolism protein IolS